jgi:hypothetical protein
MLLVCAGLLESWCARTSRCLAEPVNVAVAAVPVGGVSAATSFQPFSACT